MKGNLFICYTPYHLILALTITEQEKLEDYKIYYIDESQYESNSNPFISIKNLRYITGRKWHENYRFLKVLSTWRIYYVLKKNIKKDFSFIEKLFVFNDTREDTQFLSTLISSKTKVFAVEDGLEPYWSDKLVSHFLRKGLRMKIIKLLYGSFVQDITRYGSYFKISGFYLLSPNLVVNRNTLSNRIPINNKLFKKVAIDIGQNIYNITPQREKIQFLFLLPPSDFIMNKTSIDTFTNNIKKQVSQFGAIGIKLHPREKNKKFIENISTLGYLLPLGVPFEAIANFSLHKNCTIFGSTSTVILTSKVLLPDRIFIIYETIKPFVYEECKHIDNDIKISKLF